MARVLIVDDEPSVARSTALLLEDMGFETATCEAASQIADALVKVKPDILLQDVRMQGLDLPAFLGSLRADARWEKLPVVLFSASIDSAQISEELGLPILEKPFKPTEIVELLKGAQVRSPR